MRIEKYPPSSKKKSQVIKQSMRSRKGQQDRGKEACLTFVKPGWPPGLFVVALVVPLDPLDQNG
jgi:hypothetical protein